MCIGNLRSGTESLAAGFLDKDKSEKKRSLIYFGLIFFFVVGAVIGRFFSGILGLYSMAVNCVILLAAFIMMFWERFTGIPR